MYVVRGAGLWVWKIRILSEPHVVLGSSDVVSRPQVSYPQSEALHLGFAVKGLRLCSRQAF